MQQDMVEAQNQQIFQQLIPLLQQELGSDLVGILAAGSRIHGTPGPKSDLDIYILLASPRSCRRTAVINGVEVDQIFRPSFQVRQYIQDNATDCAMFALGKILYDPQGTVAEHKAEARILWEAGPRAIPSQELWQHRFVPSDLLRDLEDVKDDDEVTVTLLIAQICNQLLETHYQLRQHWKPKTKRCLSDLTCWDPEAARLLHTALLPGTFAERYAALVSLANHILVPIGGIMPIEWSTPWKTLPL